MTVRVRNKVNVVFIFLSIALFLLAICLVSFCYINESEEVLSPVTLCVFVLILASAILFTYIKIEFEKTQALEVIYFLLFLVAMMMETCRFAFILPIWKMTVAQKLLLTKLILFSRVLCPLALFFGAVYNKIDAKQLTEQNLFIIVIVAIFITYIYPINTQVASVLGYYECGYGTLFIFARYALLVLAILTQMIDFLHDSNRYTFPYALTLLSTGYMLLCKAQMWWQVIVGGTLLLVGAIFYLKDVHKQHAWG